MTMPIKERPVDKRCIGNSSSTKMEVHDLLNEQTNCQINEIIRAGHAVVFEHDKLQQASIEGYDNCAYCLGRSTR